MPGLESLLTHIQSKYATINALQDALNDINNTVNNEIVNIETETNNLEVNIPQTVNKSLSYHTNHTDFMYHTNHMTIEGNLLYNSIILHINEKVTKSCNFNY